MLKSEHLGKLGPAFGVGAGCGFGFALGLIGGAGLGPGMPGLQLGFGVGAGCGIGMGFGYGVGRGIAYDDRRKYTNVGKFTISSLPSQDEIVSYIDEIIVNTKKLIKATSKEMEKWRRP